jgi:hypothetical protein
MDFLTSREERLLLSDAAGTIITDRAEYPRGISPRGPHRSVLDCLQSHGSCHPVKATAFCQDGEFFLFPVDPIPVGVTCPLRSTGITPFPRYYEAVRPWPVLRYFQPRGSSTCAFSPNLNFQVLKFHTKAQTRVTPPVYRTPRIAAAGTRSPVGKD